LQRSVSFGTNAPALNRLANDLRVNRSIPFRNRIRPDEVIEAIQKHHGLMTYAAQSLGCSLHSVANMAARNPRVARAVRDAREKLTDVAVAKLHEKVRAGDIRAITFWLSSTMGRARGFNPPVSDTGSGGTDQPRVTNNFVIEFVTREQIAAEREAKVIEHEAIEEGRDDDAG
jgi:hypothetical protein